MNKRTSEGHYGHHVESPSTKKLRARLPSNETCERMARLASGFADPTRIRILSALQQQAICVGDLSLVLELSQSAVSHQLKLLKAEGLVTSARDGKHIYYALATGEEIRILELLRSANETDRNAT